MILLVLFVDLVIAARQEPWEDEIFAVSTGWSLARSQAPMLSVLGDYPRTGSPISFYGPVSFETENWLIRVFGLSLFPWRFVCFLGVPLCILVCSALVKAAGGDRWARLATALFVALAGSVAGALPGRWDFITVAFFLSGVLLFIDNIAERRTNALWGSALAGVPIGVALGSSPRALTLSVAALVAAAVIAFSFRAIWKTVYLRAIVMFSISAVVQTLLLLPWGMNSLSWYAYLRRATKSDYINATPIMGRGLWILDLKHHRLLALAFFLLVTLAALNMIKRGPTFSSGKLPLKVFLTVFASTNLILMLLLLANAFGQTPFWITPVIVAAMCWVDFKELHNRGLANTLAVLIAACLLLLSVEEVEQAAAVALTWNRRSTTAVTAFVREHVPKGSVVYGPIGNYFYPVELSGSRYLYSFEHTTPGLYSEPSASIGDKLDKRICSSRTYAIWPKPDPVHNPQVQTMPNALRERLQETVAEYDPPSLPRWKSMLVERIGEVGGKYGFPSAVIYTLKARQCGND